MDPWVPLGMDPWEAFQELVDLHLRVLVVLDHLALEGLGLLLEH